MTEPEPSATSSPDETTPPATPPPAEPAPLVNRLLIGQDLTRVSDLIARVVVQSVPGVTMIPGASSLLAATIRSSFSPVLDLGDVQLRLLILSAAQELGAYLGVREPVAGADPELQRALRELIAAMGA